MNQHSRSCSCQLGIVCSSLIPFILTSVASELTPGPHGTESSARELAILIALYVVIATLVHGCVVGVAGGLQKLLAAPQRRKIAGSFFAILLLLIAVLLFVSGRPEPEERDKIR